MIIVLDLDDTLYEEKQFVRSGMRAVAEFLSDQYGIALHKIVKRLEEILLENGRGEVFNRFLEENNLYSSKLVRKCLSVYRLHNPSISLFPGVRKLLKDLSIYPLYLVTDGNKVVQYNKVKALGIEHYFKKLYITHRYGVQNAKPSVFCFERIKAAEKCNYRDIVYIGDNPAKDFVNIRKLGIRTVRVLSGNFKSVVAKHAFDAEVKINHVTEFNINLLNH